MIRTILAAALTAALTILAALPLQAACTGESLIDRLGADQRAALDRAVAATPHAEGILWQATRDEDTLTLIGTMHIFDPRLAPLADRAEPHVAAAEVLLVEMGPDEEQALQRAMVNEPSRVFYTEGPTLPDRLDPDTWQAVQDAARARQLPPFLVAKMRPWYLMLTLSIPPCAMSDMMSGRMGLDHMLIEQAQAAGVPVRAVEPWDTIFALFDQGTEDEQIAMLRTSLADADLQEAAFVAMLDGYFAGRMAEVWEMSRLSIRMTDGLTTEEADAAFAMTEELLLDTRNLAWMKRIDEAAAAHDRLAMAVGAGHLPGEVGLLNLLEQDGWTLTRLD